MTGDSSEELGLTTAPAGPPPRRRPRGRTVGLAVLTAGALAVGAAGVAAAAHGERDPAVVGASATSNAAVPEAMDGHRGPGGRGHFGGGIGHGAIRGEFVVPKSGGGYQTIAVQRGAVTKVSDNSITVKSDDGTSRTYTVTADTLVNATRDGISTVKVKDTVHVLAVRSGSSARALRIVDISRIQSSRQRFGFPGRAGAAQSGA